MTGLSSDAELRKHLDRWVAEGLIDTAQATRIETAEVPATGPAGTGPAGTGPAATGSRAPLVAEALGYAGGVLAIAAGLRRRSWVTMIIRHELGAPVWILAECRHG